MMIWFITYDGLPDLDPDDRLAAEVLKERGHSCEPKCWDDPKVDWSQCQVGVVRSTWDYHTKYAKFEEWLKQPHLQNRLFNQPELMSWNTRKTYLRELQQHGVDIVPTSWLEKNSTHEQITQFLSKARWQNAVMKPTIGLATAGVSKIDLKAPDAVNKIAELVNQPYMQEVERSGERALMFFDGKYSHAAKKSAFQHMAAAGDAGEQAIQPDPDEIAFGYHVLQALGKSTLYARVDVVRDTATDQPVLMELELVEPSLFLQFHDEAPKRFADAIENAIAKTRTAV
jgi:glutathione synthase/RimK-type ligase-like ATP-grasp enzyme